MQTLNQHEKAIRYLGIAVVATSALALLGIIIGFIFIGVGHAAWNAYGPDIIQQGYEYGRGHHGSGYYGDLSVSEAMGLAGLGIGLGYVALGWELITAVVSLVAGILAIRGAADRTKLGGVFGWGIAGAIAAFLGGRLITCVLMIIVAVLAHKDKNAPAYPQAAYGAPAAGWSQPTAPAAGGYAAPAAAPAQAPTSPVDPQAQAYQAAYQQSYGAPVATQPATGWAAPAPAATAAAAQAPAAAAASQAVAPTATQAAAAVNAAESGEAARAAQEYAAGVASVEAADVAALAADAAQAEAAAEVEVTEAPADETVTIVVEAAPDDEGQPKA